MEASDCLHVCQDWLLGSGLHQTGHWILPLCPLSGNPFFYLFPLDKVGVAAQNLRLFSVRVEWRFSGVETAF
jgi:hypothetical protein